MMPHCRRIRSATGRVIGSTTEAGVARRGIDRESVIEIRDGALRIHPLVIPGWNRAGISYGPFERRDGLGLAIHVLNADNGSETYRLASVVRRLGRWALASQTDSLWTRLLRWPFRLVGNGVTRKLRYWYSACHIEKAYRPMRENLAVGWFAADAPADAAANGDAFVVRGANVHNGELDLCIGDRLLPVIESLPNVPFYYFVLLRENGSAYYIASHDHVPGAAAYPAMRPIAINATSTGTLLYPGLHQSMAGESGFTAETVLYHAHVARYAALSAWYGTAHAADRLTGDGRLAGSKSETGAEWQALTGDPERSADGARPGGSLGMACLLPDKPTGLIHAVMTIASDNGKAGIVWRLSDARNYLALLMSRDGCELVMVAGGERAVLQTCDPAKLDTRRPLAVQIRDDGDRNRRFRERPPRAGRRPAVRGSAGRPRRRNFRRCEWRSVPAHSRPGGASPRGRTPGCLAVHAALVPRWHGADHLRRLRRGTRRLCGIPIAEWRLVVPHHG